MKKKEGKIDFVKWFSELNKDSGAIAGGKGANLSEIYNLKIPVPGGFVITAQAYDYFIEKAGIGDKIKELLSKIDYENTQQLNDVTQEIREMIIKADFPKEIEEEVTEAYETLGTPEKDYSRRQAHDLVQHFSEPIFVAVRSSATTEDLAEASFAGQQDSFVNVKGNTELIKHVKKAFASLFTARATYYRNKKGFKHAEASLAVVVQKMVDSDKSGVIFSKDPSYKNDNIILEAVWGLGEGIVSGKITPDTYIVSKDMEIMNKKIAIKKIAITRNSSGEKEVVKLREEKSKHQVLKDHEIKKLSELAKTLEEHYKKPQDIEFAIEGEEIFIVQTRPITTAQKISGDGQSRELHGEVLLTGLGASPGIAFGKIKIVNNLKDLAKINKGDILVTKMTDPDMVVTMPAHAAIVSREMGIPAVVGTQEATTKLKENEIITVNGFTGKVYKGKVSETVQKEVLPVTAKTKTEIKVIVDLPSFANRAAKTKLKKVGLTRIEGIIAESGKHPEYFLEQNKIKDYEEVIFKGIKTLSQPFEELWIRTSDIRSDEFQDLEGAPQEKEANPMLGFHGIRYSLKKPEILKAELNALKRVAEGGKTIGILLPQVISVDELKKTKEYIKEVGFKDLKVGIMIETPASVQLIDDLCKEGIDFISFGTNDLTQYMLAIDRGNEAVQDLYDEMHPAILYQLGFVIRVCKRNNVQTSICGQAGSKKPMAKFLVERGIDSISVNADVAAEIAEYVAEIEESLTKGTDKEPRQYQPKQEEPSKKQEKPEEPKPLPPQVTNKPDPEPKKVEPVKEPSEPEAEKPKIEKVINDKPQEEDKSSDVDNKSNQSSEAPKEEEKEFASKEDIEAIEKEKAEFLKAHPEEEEETKEEIIEDIKQSGVPEDVAKAEEKLDEEAYEEKPEFSRKEVLEEVPVPKPEPNEKEEEENEFSSEEEVEKEFKEEPSKNKEEDKEETLDIF